MLVLHCHLQVETALEAEKPSNNDCSLLRSTVVLFFTCSSLKNSV